MICDFCRPETGHHADYACQGCGGLLCRRCSEERGIKVAVPIEGSPVGGTQNVYYCDEDTCPADALAKATEVGSHAYAGHGVELAGLRERGLALVLGRAA